MTALTIERDAHSQQFVIVHNRVARDMTLKRDAKGLLVELLSLPPGQRIATDALIGRGIEGRDAVRRMLRDLENVGYITRTKTQDKSGHWQWRLVVRETPQCPNSPEPENPSMVPPAETDVFAGQPIDGFSGDKRRSTTSKKDGGTSLRSFPSDQDQSQSQDPGGIPLPPDPRSPHPSGEALTKSGSKKISTSVARRVTAPPEGAGGAGVTVKAGSVAKSQNRRLPNGSETTADDAQGISPNDSDSATTGTTRARRAAA